MTGSCYIAQVSLELTAILQPQPSECTVTSIPSSGLFQWVHRDDVPALQHPSPSLINMWTVSTQRGGRNLPTKLFFSSFSGESISFLKYFSNLAEGPGLGFKPGSRHQLGGVWRGRQCKRGSLSLAYTLRSSNPGARSLET